MFSILKLFTGIALLLTAAGSWLTNFEKAKEEAQQQDKNIILVFAGSDWCAPCIKLEKNIWESEEFKAEANKSWILLKADFPKKKANALPREQAEHNAMLYEKYNKEGTFPLVVLLDKTGKVLGKTTYKNISPQEYIKQLHALEKK